MPAEATIADVIAPFGLPMKLVHLVLVNGVYVQPEERASAHAEGRRRAGDLAADRRRLNPACRHVPAGVADAFEREIRLTEAEWLRAAARRGAASMRCNDLRAAARG